MENKKKILPIGLLLCTTHATNLRTITKYIFKCYFYVLSLHRMITTGPRFMIFEERINVTRIDQGRWIYINDTGMKGIHQACGLAYTKNGWAVQCVLFIVIELLCSYLSAVGCFLLWSIINFQKICYTFTIILPKEIRNVKTMTVL